MRQKFNWLLAGLFILACISPSYVKAEFYPIHVSQGQAEMPFLHVMRNGDIMVVFVEGHHFNSDAILYYRILKKETGQWTPTKQVVAKSFSSAFPQIAEDEDGNLHMVYMDGNASTNREIWYIKYDYATQEWGKKYLAYVSSGLNSSWPRIRIENDKIYIMWTHNYDPAIGNTDLCMIINDIDGTWPVETKSRKTISNTGQSASVHNFFDIKNNKIAVIWMDDNHKAGNWGLYYSEGSWAPEQKKWNFTKYLYVWPGANQYYPGLVMDDDYNVHVIFSHKYGPFFYARKDNITKKWTEPKSISTAGCTYSLLTQLLYKKGLLHLVWRQTSGGAEALVYGRGLPSTGQWIKPVKVAEGLEFPGYTSVDLDEDGEVHFVFSDGDEDHPRHIFYGNVELPGKPPVVDIAASKYGGLIPLKVNFDGSKTKDPDGRINEYRWEFGDGTTAKGKTASHTFNTTGVFTVSLTAIDNDMLIGVGKVQIRVTTGEPVAVIEAVPSSGFAPLEVSFDASKSSDEDGRVVSYDWDLGDGTNSTDVKFIHTYEHGGSYNVSLEVKDNDKKTGTTVKNIRVYEKPVAAFTATPEGGKIPLTVSFDASASVDHDGTIEEYYWNFGDGAKGEGVTVTHTYEDIGNFHVTLVVVDNEGYFDSANFEIKAYYTKDITAKFTASVSEGVIPLTVNFDATESSAGQRGISAYAWNFGDGQTASGMTPAHTFVNAGVYSVVLIVEDWFGYTDNTSKIITVYGKPFAPLSAQYQTLQNRSFLFTDFINRVTWIADSENDNYFNVVQYRIYRKNKGESDSQFTLVGEVNSSTLMYDDRKFADKASAENCVYAVTAVDDQGRESDFGKSGL